MEPILPDIELLYDFLYVDGRRVATYIAQLDPNGTLTGIKTSASGSTTVTGTGKIGVAVASGTIGGTDMAAETAERQFDPIHTIPIAMMNRLDELGFIHRSLIGTGIGSLVLAKGFCRLINIGLVKEMWPALGKFALENPDVDQEQGLAQNRHDRRVNAAKPKPKSKSVPSTVFELVQHLPHAIEMHMVCPNEGLGVGLWCTLKPDCLLSSAEDLGLKHGSAIPGEWYVLGILDSGVGTDLSAAWDDLPTNQISKSIVRLLSEIRQLMGRPDDYNSITPLMIFRKVERLQSVSQGSE